MSKVKFYYYDGKVTSRKPNKKEKTLLKVYKNIIGFDVEIVYRQDQLMEWMCEAESENPAHNYFIKSEYRFEDGLSTSSGFGKKSALDYMISIFKQDLNNYYDKFAQHYGYFKGK